MTLNKILQCDYPRGGLGISRDGDDLMRAKIKTPKISRASNNPPPPPQSVKFSSLKNSQKALKTQKEIPLIFPTQLNQKFQTQKNPLIIPVSRNPEYPHCGDYTSKLFLVAFSLGESGGSRLQKSGGVNSPTSLLS